MALTQVVDDYEQLATALYGDGAWELVKKRALTAAQMQEKRERTQARVGLASNVVGLAAGVGGTAAALRDERFKGGGKLAGKLARVATKIPAPISGKGGKVGAALAGGALGLQVANIAGDAVANRVLSRSAQKKPKLTKVSKSDDLDFVITGEISKSNDKRQVFGWASVVELNGQPVVDLQGDYMAIDVIEKAAYDYVHSSRRGGDMHKDGSHASDLIESFIVTPEKKKLLGLPDDTPTGWWVGFQVNDDEVWQMVKDGKRPEFSIHGSGQRVDVEI